MPDFDYQWKNLPSQNIEYNQDRVQEFCKFTGLGKDALAGKACLDAGCGNGRYTYAMLELGASRVDSIDISAEAIARCQTINPTAKVADIMTLEPNPSYDFVLCWGVLNHVPEPRAAFARIASQVAPGRMLHIMVYHKKTQKPYEQGRRLWPSLSLDEKLRLCEEQVNKFGGDLHGWFDAFNPTCNWSFEEKEPKKWFKEEGFEDVRLISKYNINMNGKKRISGAQNYR